MLIKNIKTLNSYFGFVDTNDLVNKCLIFSTKQNTYLYDTGTSKIFLFADSQEIKVFRALINQVIEMDIESEVIERVADIVKKENLLKGIVKKGFYDIDRDYIVDKIEHKLTQITLEVTQQCNLRCKYCIYGHNHLNFRNFESKEMTWDIAQKAIEYARDHSAEHIVISFYGGEPLLKFELIKKAVNYARKIIMDKELSFSMTTNMVLMDEEKAEFIAKTPHFSVTASIDGPEQIHNKNRVDRNGKGTFAKSIKGLQKLVFAMQQHNKKLRNYVSISMVLDQPFLNSTYDDIQTFFENLDWLPKDIEKMVTYADYPSDYVINQPREEREYIDEWILEKDNMDNFYSGTLQSVLYPIHARHISEDAQEFMKMNGCCIPGSRKLYVTAVGEFKVCERIGKSPAIGNVYCGIDFSKLFKVYIDEFQEKGKSDCSNCWASTLCNVCYARYYDENGFNIEEKMKVCESTRKELHDFLILYHTYLEENPEIISKLNNIEVVS